MTKESTIEMIKNFDSVRGIFEGLCIVDDYCLGFRANEKIASIIEAYWAGEKISPIVVFNESPLNGSHRIAASAILGEWVCEVVRYASKEKIKVESHLRAVEAYLEEDHWEEICQELLD